LNDFGEELSAGLPGRVVDEMQILNVFKKQRIVFPSILEMQCPPEGRKIHKPLNMMPPELQSTLWVFRHQAAVFAMGTALNPFLIKLPLG
jgi:hypothetical protein